MSIKYLYDPYGNTLSQSGPIPDANLYRFSSKEFHANSGLVYYLYRFYEPNLQRWINRDPIGESAFPNLYTFNANAPIDTSDALGLKPIWLPPLPPLPPAWPVDPPFPYPLPNWPGATTTQRLQQCLADCKAKFNSDLADCTSTYVGNCPFKNPVLRALDTFGSAIDFAVCVGVAGTRSEICKKNCYARSHSPWN